MTEPPKHDPPPRGKRTALDWFTMGYLVFSALAIAALIIISTVLVSRTASESAANTRLIAAQQQASIIQCRLANENRQQDIAIWNRLLTVSPPPKDPAALREIAELEHLVKIKDTPRNCTAAFGAG